MVFQILTCTFTVSPPPVSIDQNKLHGEGQHPNHRKVSSAKGGLELRNRYLLDISLIDLSVQLEMLLKHTHQYFLWFLLMKRKKKSSLGFWTFLPWSLWIFKWNLGSSWVLSLWNLLAMPYDFRTWKNSYKIYNSFPPPPKTESSVGLFRLNEPHFW